MDKKKIIAWIGIFLVGVIIGGLICYLFCFKCDDECRHICKHKTEKEGKGITTDVQKITVDSANAYFKCYMKNPLNIDTLVAFSVSMDQFNVMQSLKEENDTAVKGFRVYLGVMGDPTSINMVVATDVKGRDMTQSIYRTPISDPCPPLCDYSSGIIK